MKKLKVLLFTLLLLIGICPNNVSAVIIGTISDTTAGISINQGTVTKSTDTQAASVELNDGDTFVISDEIVLELNTNNDFIVVSELWNKNSNSLYPVDIVTTFIEKEDIESGTVTKSISFESLSELGSYTIVTILYVEETHGAHEIATHNKNKDTPKESITVSKGPIGIGNTQLKLNIAKPGSETKTISASSSELTSVEILEEATYTIQDEVTLSNYDDTYEYYTESYLYLGNELLEQKTSTNVKASVTVTFNTSLTQIGVYSIVTELYKVGEADPLSVHNSSKDIFNESIELKELETVDISFTKKWVNDEESSRPDSIKVILLADGVKDDEITVNKSDDYSGIFEGKPKNNDGKAIEYTIKEDTPANYTSVVSGDIEKGFVITNTYNPKPDPKPEPKPEPKPDVPKTYSLPKTGVE